MMGGGYSGGMLLGGLFWIVLLLGAGTLLYVLVVRMQGEPKRTFSGPEDPLSVLKIRYARGELSREQYQQMMSDLTQREDGQP